MEFPWISMVLEAICDPGEYLCMTSPKYSIFGHLKVKTNQLTQREGQGSSINMSEGQGHIPYMEENGHLKVKVGHLTTLA